MENDEIVGLSGILKHEITKINIPSTLEEFNETCERYNKKMRENGDNYILCGSESAKLFHDAIDDYIKEQENNGTNGHTKIDK